MRTTYSMLKRQLVIAGIGVTSVFACSSAFAGPEGATPSAADETTPSMSTLLSLDRVTGGYKGWGPMANPQVPQTTSESGPNDYNAEKKDRGDKLAEVSRAREAVWVANAPLRAPYQIENIGATKAAAAGGTVRFDSNDPR